MATQTTNIGLRKPGRDNYVSVVTDINDNMDKIDAAVGALPSGASLQAEISGKADKASNATNNNFAALDANGNLKDSGHKHSDYLTEHQDISGKADKVSSPTSGNFAGLDANGNLTDSGHKHSDYLTAHQDISGKADKVSGATSGDLAALDANGNLTDSGKKTADFVLSSEIGTVPSGQTVQGQIDALNSGKANAVDASVSTPADVMTIQDGADGMPMRVTVGIEPVQDLNGQEFPWPGGAGRNLFNKDDSSLQYSGYLEATTGKYTTGSSLSTRMVYIPCKASTSYIVSNDVTTTLRVGSFTALPTTNTNSTAQNAPTGATTAGTGLSITTGASDAYLLIQVMANDDITGGMTLEAALAKLMVEEGSTVHTWEPYSNICSISGWTGAKVTRTGKNLCDGTYIKNRILDNLGSSHRGIDSDYPTFIWFIPTASDGYVSLFGDNSLNGYRFKENTAYTFVMDVGYQSGASMLNIGITYTDGTSHAFMASEIASSANPGWIVYTTSGSKTLKAIWIGPNVGKWTSLEFTTMGIYEGTVTLAEHLTQTSQTYQISFPSPTPGTVYGGMLTLNKYGEGSLVVNRIKYGYTDLDFEAYTLSNGVQVFRATKNWTFNGASCISNMYREYDTLADLRADGVVSGIVGGVNNFSASTPRIVIRDDTCATLSDLATKISATFEVVVEVDSPVSYTLTAEQILSLLGTNTIWADCGNVLSVDYSADTKAYIDNLFASIVNATGVSF